MRTAPRRPQAVPSLDPGSAVVFLAVGLGYLITAQMAWSLFGAANIGLSFFPAAGITLGAMLVLPRRRWPAIVAAIVVAETAVDLRNGLEIGWALVYAAANVVEPLAGALAIGWLAKRREPPIVDISTRPGLARFLLGGVVIGPLVGAIVGATAKTMTSSAPWARNVWGWWIGDGLGVLAVAAAIVALSDPEIRSQLRDRRRLSWLSAGVVASMIALQVPKVTSYLIVPVLMLVALSAGTGGVAIVGLVTALVANVATALGTGAFSDIDGITAHQQLLDTQLLVGATLVAAYLLAVEVGERERVEQQRMVEHEARVRAESMQAVGALSRDLAKAHRVEDVVAALSAHAHMRLHPRALGVNIADPVTGRFTWLASEGFPERGVAAASDFTLDAPLPGPETARSGRPVFLRTFDEIRIRYPLLVPVAEVAGTQSLVTLPLSTHDQTNGYLIFTWGEPHEFDEEERIYLGAVGDVVGQSIERARLMERDHDLAIELQHAMLGRPDDVDAVVTASAYRPAGDDVEIGGDWYDTIRLSEDRTAFVVGDVVGHSLTAAKAMGQIRSAIRTLVPLFPDPVDLIERLEPFVSRTDGGVPTTLVYAVHDARTGRLRYSCAGHPPPLVVAGDGTATFLPDGRGTPLGMQLGSGPVVGEAAVRPGDTMILYTDGLVERRGEPLDEGLERLRAAAIRHADAAPDQLCDQLVRSLGQSDDDIAILVVRPARPAFRRWIDAQPGALAALRADLRGWLGGQGVDDDDVSDVLVSAGEAVANAVEHAYVGRLLGEVRVDADVVAEDSTGFGVVDLRVRDEGRWRRPTARGNRGRGETMMRALADDVRIRTDGSGTSVRIRRRVRLGEMADR